MGSSFHPLTHDGRGQETEERMHVREGNSCAGIGWEASDSIPAPRSQKGSSAPLGRCGSGGARDGCGLQTAAPPQADSDNASIVMFAKGLDSRKDEPVRRWRNSASSKLSVFTCRNKIPVQRAQESIQSGSLLVIIQVSGLQHCRSPWVQSIGVHCPIGKLRGVHTN